jgi:hypothetical protein
MSFSVYLCLTDARGIGAGRIVVSAEETNEVVYLGELHSYDFGNDPIELSGFVIRVPLCLFPTPGVYRVEFVYNEAAVKEYSLLTRLRLRPTRRVLVFDQ